MVSVGRAGHYQLLTLDLLEALFVYAGYLYVLLLQVLQTWNQGDGDPEVIILGIIFVFRPID